MIAQGLSKIALARAKPPLGIKMLTECAFCIIVVILKASIVRHGSWFKSVYRMANRNFPGSGRFGRSSMERVSLNDLSEKILK